LTSHEQGRATGLSATAVLGEVHKAGEPKRAGMARRMGQVRASPDPADQAPALQVVRVGGAAAPSPPAESFGHALADTALLLGEERATAAAAAAVRARRPMRFRRQCKRLRVAGREHLGLLARAHSRR
jgi:hypothetical protein